MTYDTIQLSIDGPVATISLNRPNKLNAINTTMLHELGGALDTVEDDDAVMAIVLHGNGRSFCAGFDLKASVDKQRRSEQEWRAALEYDLAVIMRFWHCEKPTIAAVHGYALAAGFELALACDMTVCGTGAMFGEPEVRFGSSIVALLLPWYANPKRTKKMLLTGEDRMTAQEALQLGLVNEVVADSEVLTRGKSLALGIALMDPDSVRLTKKAINRTYQIMGMNQALNAGLETSIEIETAETEVRREFNRIVRKQGLKAALKWREARLGFSDASA
ncbi:MAG: enoyl-CoA hydratase/isomerase family protein [Acidiferrobacterales bacterium]|nr:enoyl-CoA hydratase/isomerase family protein [Acidiferrobacterales bacterium]